MKNYIKAFVIYMTIASLLIFSCQKDDAIVETVEIKKSVKTRTISLSDIPEVKTFLTNEYNSNFFKSTEIDGAIFDEDNIMEVIDTLQYTNYSFKFRYSDTPIGTFYNLVVGKTSLGELNTPFVLKFTSNEETLEEYLKNDLDFRFFKGKVAYHRYTDFFDEGSILKTDLCPSDLDKNGDPIPCDEYDLNDSTGSGTSSGSTEPNTDSTSDGTGGTETSEGSSTPSTGLGGQDCTVEYVYETRKCYDTPSDNCTYFVGFIVTCGPETTTKSLLNSNDECLGCETTPPGTIAVNSEFDNVDVRALTGNAKCVYNKLKSQNGNLFKTTIGEFLNDATYDLILQSGGECNSPTDDACTNPKDLDNGNITIKIRNEGRGTLDLAATILHEAIHAEIYRYVDRYNKGLDPQNRANLLGYYFQYQADNGGNYPTVNAQHQHMADKYVRPIAEAIRSLDNNKYPLEDYMAFGWEGLRKYGWDGYYDNGKWVKLDRSEYASIEKKVLDNTEFNRDCNN